jgi:YVTN family beta-propeller protein
MRCLLKDFRLRTFPVEVVMQIRRWLSFAALLSLWAVCLSCGQNYRLPIIQIPGIPVDPKLYHFAMTISTNDPATNANIPGTVMQIDVVGDMDVGEANLGRGPVHAALLPTGAANRIYVANGLEDTVSTTTAAPASCSPGPVCPIGRVSTITMPVGSSPSYVASSEAANVYVILSGLNPPELGVISTGQNALIQQIALPAGNPVAMVELPNGHKLYVVDQANSAVYVVDLATRQIVQTLSVGVAPTMAVASPDSSAVYVMSNIGISVIDALTDQLVPGGLSTTGQPNSMTYDANQNRLYVTDTGGRVGVFNTAIAAGTLPNTLLISPAGFVAGAMGITPLPSGTKFYVLGNPSGTSLTLTAINALTFVASSPYTLDLLNPGSVPVAPVPLCSNVRFRYMASASADSARVYVSSCDAGGTYIFRTSDNAGVLLLPSPNQPPVGGVTKPQNPVFLIAGR